MANLWPWLAVAGLGAVHGLNPASGWSFMMSTAHGTGLMLVPALIPICIADAPAREITASGSFSLALAAVAVHTAAMLAVVGLIAVGTCRGVDLARRWVRRSRR